MSADISKRECRICNQLFLPPKKETLGIMWQHVCVPCTKKQWKYLKGRVRS